MNMKKIQVPPAMLDAAIASVARLDPWSGVTVEHYRTVLEAALQWLSENPIVPTREQAEKMYSFYADFDADGIPSMRETLIEWQRLMLQDQRSNPEIEITGTGKLAQVNINGSPVAVIYATPQAGAMENAEIMKRGILEAYRFGQESK